MPTNTPLHNDQIRSRFQALDRFLLDHQSLWRPRPFTHLQLPWESQHAELATWLRQRTLEQAEAAHNQPEHLVAPQPFPQLAAEAIQLSHVGPLPATELDSVQARMSVDVPGRKWQRSKPSPAACSSSTPPHTGSTGAQAKATSAADWLTKARP